MSFFVEFFLIFMSSHNDMPWNIRKFAGGKLNTLRALETGLQHQDPWSKSAWSHTDLPRLREGRVGAQVCTHTIQFSSIQFDSTQLCVSGFVLSLHEKKRTLYLLCHSNRTRYTTVVYKPPKKRDPLKGLCYTSSSGLHPRCSIRDCPYSIYPAVSLSFLYEYFNTFGCFAQMRHSAARCLCSKIPPALSSSLLCVHYNR